MQISEFRLGSNKDGVAKNDSMRRADGARADTMLRFQKTVSPPRERLRSRVVEQKGDSVAKCGLAPGLANICGKQLIPQEIPQ